MNKSEIHERLNAIKAKDQQRTQDRMMLSKYSKAAREITRKADKSTLPNHGRKGYHLDHIYPIRKAYDKELPPCIAADITNLMYISSSDNLRKGTRLIDNEILRAVITALEMKAAARKECTVNKCNCLNNK